MTEEIKVRVVCPKCSKSDYIKIDKGTLKKSGKGLTTILIPDETICDHSFQIFVDKNGAVRGYETPDFELKFTPGEDEKEEELGERNILQVVWTTFSDELFYKCIRTVVSGGIIICISEHDFLKENLGTFFKKILGENCPEIQVVNVTEYNKSIRKQIYASSHKNAFVFNADLGAIIKERFKEGFLRGDKFDFEEKWFAKYDLNEMSDADIIGDLKSRIDLVLGSAEKIKKAIEDKKIKNKKDAEAEFQKAIGKDVSFKILDEILKYRYDFDAEKVFFNVNAKVDKLNSLF